MKQVYSARQPHVTHWSLEPFFAPLRTRKRRLASLLTVSGFMERIRFTPLFRFDDFSTQLLLPKEYQVIDDESSSLHKEDLELEAWQAGVATLAFMLREQVPFEVLIKVINTRFGRYAPTAAAANPQVTNITSMQPSQLLLEATVVRLVQMIEYTRAAELRYLQQYPAGSSAALQRANEVALRLQQLTR